jgi:disulfide bond formation protein DsbB
MTERRWAVSMAAALALLGAARGEVAMRFVSMVLMLAAGLGAAGCLKKATYSPNPKGGYTLHTATDSLDKAMIRFQRTAAYLCPEGSYDFGEPVVGDPTSTPVEYDVAMTCTPP